MAVGSLAGALIAARRAKPRAAIVEGAGLGFGGVAIVSGLMPTYVSLAAVLPLVGLASLTMVTSANAMIQLTTSPVMRGRVSALYLMIFMGGTPAGAPIIGWVGEEFGARWTLIGGGIASILGIAAAALYYLRHEDRSREHWRRTAVDLRTGRARVRAG
jgi:MFS family permease